jgi:hypothetical protein
MKKASNYLLVVLAVFGVIFFSSCTKDEEVIPDGPSIEVTSDQFPNGGTQFAGTAGDNISFTVDVDAPGGFNNIKVEYLVDGNDSGIADWTDQRTPGTTALTYTGTPTGIALLESNVGQEISIVITAVDDNSKTATLTLTATVASTPLESVVVTLLAAPDDNQGKRESKTFYSVPLARNVTADEVVSNEAGTASSADVDFGYFYGSSNEASIVAPSEYTAYDLGANGQQWSTLNETAFKTTSLTAAQFLEVTTYAEVEEAFADGTDAGTGVNKLAVDQVIAFETVERDSKTRKGLIRITAIVAGNGSDGKVDIEVLVQK